MKQTPLLRTSTSAAPLFKVSIALMATAMFFACAKRQTVEPTTTTPAPTPVIADGSEAYADALIAAAQKAEPEVSPLLRSVAKAAGGELWGFDYRFKSRKSLLRKINKIVTENPGKIVEDVRINDALRYTILIDDSPQGNYTETLRKALEEFEALGHRVDQVKNYWPTGDNYSGVNCVLMTASGLYWELQFHTRASKKTNSENRAMYEELRITTTPLKRKRQLFDRMTEAWDVVPVPSAVLVERSLHEKEAIISRDRP